MEKKNDNEFGKLSKQETHTEKQLVLLLPTPNHDILQGVKCADFSLHV